MAKARRDMKLWGPGGKKYDRAILTCTHVTTNEDGTTTKCDNEFFEAKAPVVGNVKRQCEYHRFHSPQAVKRAEKATKVNRETVMLRALGFIA